MFRFKMSAQGPSTRSNLARSSLTVLSGPRDMTVAARGRSNSKAISPAGERERFLCTGKLVQTARLSSSRLLQQHDFNVKTSHSTPTT